MLGKCSLRADTTAIASTLEGIVSTAIMSTDDSTNNRIRGICHRLRSSKLIVEMYEPEYLNKNYFMFTRFLLEGDRTLIRRASKHHMDLRFLPPKWAFGFSCLADTQK
mmetsp:Transcript_21671/g.42112  ORF Transcript_21671/g.42112 Transcript_21671/m.42112 type:complete len:108 (+) Transcript_21671:450-773(+)